MNKRRLLMMFPKTYTIIGILFSDVKKGMIYPHCKSITEKITAGSRLLAHQKFRERHPDYLIHRCTLIDVDISGVIK
jgi:hypothetical protein